MTDTDALVEAVAKAMFESAYERHGLEMSWTVLPTKIQSAWLSNARAALSAIEAAGWRVVPVKPTQEMIKAASYKPFSYAVMTDTEDGAYFHDVWPAMLSAAPRIGGEK